MRGPAECRRARRAWTPAASSTAAARCAASAHRRARVLGTTCGPSRSAATHCCLPAVSTLLLPFVVSTFVARAWPALRHLWQAAAGRLQAAWHSRGAKGEPGAARVSGVCAARQAADREGTSLPAGSTAFVPCALVPHCCCALAHATPAPQTGLPSTWASMSGRSSSRGSSTSSSRRAAARPSHLPSFSVTPGVGSSGSCGGSRRPRRRSSGAAAAASAATGTASMSRRAGSSRSGSGSNRSSSSGNGNGSSARAARAGAPTVVVPQRGPGTTPRAFTAVSACRPLHPRNRSPRRFARW